MADYQLTETDDLDIHNIVLKVEKSFGIQFESNELETVSTFGQFCDAVAKKIQLTSVSDCTSQQAFYKLRQALVLYRPSCTITPKTCLKLVVPNKRRRQFIRSVEAELGFELDILGSPKAIATANLIVFVVSLLALWVHAAAGLIGICISIMSMVYADEYGTTLRVETVGQVVERMTRSHYIKSRRNPATANQIEMVKQLQTLFQHELGLDLPLLSRDARF